MTADIRAAAQREAAARYAGTWRDEVLDAFMAGAEWGAARALEDAADDHDQALGGETYGGAYLRARAKTYREEKNK